MNWPTFAFILSDAQLLVLVGLCALLIILWAMLAGNKRRPPARPAAQAAPPQPITSRRVRAGAPVPDRRQPRKPAA